MQDLSKFDTDVFYKAYMEAIEKCLGCKNENNLLECVKSEMRDAHNKYADFMSKKITSDLDAMLERNKEYSKNLNIQLQKTKAETERTKKYLEELK